MKPIILLITVNQTLFRSFEMNMPDVVQCRMISSEEVLNEEEDPLESEEILAIVLDTQFPNSERIYPILANRDHLSYLPVIAVLHEVADREVVLIVLSVDLYVAFAGLQVNPGDRRLPSACCDCVHIP